VIFSIEKINATEDGAVSAAPLHVVPSSVELGQLVRTQRIAQRLTQTDLSLVAGVSPLFVHNLEHGKATVRLSTVLRVLDALGLTLALTGGVPDVDA
jgi:y4mF family transcriptional regulator